jgi:hypothetical protein
MKSNNFLNNVNSLLALIFNVIKIGLVVGIVYFISTFYSDLIGMFQNFGKGNKLPSYKLEDIMITVDDNFNKHSKSILQKINERWFHGEEQHIKVSGYNNINIIVDGQLNKHSRNDLIKKELCVIYEGKYNEEVDLNKKRVYDVLKDFYCL